MRRPALVPPEGATIAFARPRGFTPTAGLMLLAVTSMAAQAPPGSGPPSGPTTPPAVEVRQVMKPPEGQRIRFGEGGAEYPPGTVAWIDLSVEGSSGSTTLETTYVRSVGPAALFRSAAHGFFVTGPTGQLVPAIPPGFSPVASYAPGPTPNESELVGVYRTQFWNGVNQILDALAQQDEAAQAEQCYSLAQLPHPAAGRFLRKLAASKNAEVAAGAKGALARWRELDALVGGPASPPPRAPKRPQPNPGGP